MWTIDSIPDILVEAIRSCKKSWTIKQAQEAYEKHAANLESWLKLEIGPGDDTELSERVLSCDRLNLVLLVKLFLDQVRE